MSTYAAEAQNGLELEVKDFGPIIEARIDLRPLTVFVGPSNTGKSYLAILIYALHRHFSGGGLADRRHFSRRIPPFGGSWSKKQTEETVVGLTTLSEWIMAHERRVEPEGFMALPGPVMDVLRFAYDDHGEYLCNELNRCFGIADIAALIRKGTTDTASISFHKRRLAATSSIDHRLTICASESCFSTVIPDGAEIGLGVGRDFNILRHRAMEFVSLNNRERTSSFAMRQFFKALSDNVRPWVVGPFHLPAFYLPADRTGVMHAHRVVVSALIGTAAMTGLRPATRTPVLSGVLADFLEQLIDLDDPVSERRRQGYVRRRGHDIDAQIERLLLGGSIGVDKSEAIGYPSFTYTPTGWRDSLSLTNASSMVSELAPVILYLRHMVEPGNVFIVEEPESHLHPAMQVEFTRQLAALVKAGIRVIVTTHSDWVLEELANIIRRSELPAPDADGPVGNQISLPPEHVGVWLFERKKRPKGSVVKEMRLDAETGLYPTDYDVVREALYNESVNIFNRTQG